MQNWTREQHHPFNIFRSRNIFLEFIVHEHCSPLASQIFLGSKDRSQYIPILVYDISDRRFEEKRLKLNLRHFSSRTYYEQVTRHRIRFKEVKSKIKYQIFISSYIPIKLIYCKFFNKNLSPISQRSKILVRSRRQELRRRLQIFRSKSSAKNSS